MDDNPFQVHADVIDHYDPSHLNRAISNEHEFIVSAPPPSDYVPRSSGDFVPNNTRKPLPDLARKTQQQKKKFAAAQLAKGLDGSAESNAQMFAALEKCAASVGSSASPNTLRKRTLVLARWNAMLGQLQPTWPEDRYWDFGVVHEYAKLFLPYLVQNIEPHSKFNKTIKARTLDSWCTIFIVIIGQYTIEPGTLEKAGQLLLTKHGLYHFLRDQVVHLVHKHKLDRHYEPRQYLGREHLALVFNTMLSSTTNIGRQVVIQSMVRLAITFFTTARGSTQGPTHTKWRELGYFIKIGHVRVFRKSENTWSIMLFFGEFKCAIGTVTADEQVHTLDGVLHSHNILFDPTVTLIAHLFLRDAFQRKYKSIAEICLDDRAELPLDPSMKDEPLFLACDQGGRNFVVPQRAAMSDAASDSSAHWTRKAGLPRAGVTAWRRDAGNMYGLQLGERIARDLMNHSTSGVFRESYSRNTNNISTVGIRLGEVAGTNETTPGEMLEANAMRHMFLNTAIECIVRNKDTDPVEEKKKEKAEIKAFVDSIPEMQVLKKKLDHDWKLYLSHFNDAAATYEAITANANRLYGLASGAIPPPLHQKSEVTFLPGEAPKAKRSLASLVVLFADIAALHKSSARKKRDGRAIDHSHSMIKMGATGTTDERNAAAIESKKISSHVVQAFADHKPAPKSLRWSPSTDPSAWKASLTQELHRQREIAETEEVEEDEPELDENVRMYDKMLKKFLPGKATREDITLPEGIEPISSKDTNAEIPADCSGPAVEESQEIDILQIPVGVMRKAMLEYLVTPVLDNRLLEQYKVTEEEMAQGSNAGFHCPKCMCYTHRTPVPSPVFATLSKLHRHFAYQHSGWKDMELDMIKQDSLQFHCPAGDFRQASAIILLNITFASCSSDEIENVWSHVISDSCARQQQHADMLEVHLAEIQKFSYHPEAGSGHVPRADRAARLSLTDRNSDIIAQPILRNTDIVAQSSLLEEFKAIREEYYADNPGFSLSEWLEDAAPEVAQPSFLEEFKAIRDQFYVDNPEFLLSEWESDTMPDVLNYSH